MRFSCAFLLYTLIGCSTLRLVQLTSKSGRSQLYFNRLKIPKKTPDPININSTAVLKVGGLSPFTLHANLADKVIVTNNGKLVEIILEQPFTLSLVTGGVLGKDKYRFKKIKYVWTDNTKGIAATTVDGKGYPLENIATFYNQKYGSFENALKHRDGLAEVDFRIAICSVPNLLFDKYIPILKQVQKAGSTAKTTLGTAIAWFAANSFIPPFASYYSYPGSYFDETTGKRYYSATVIVLPHAFRMCLTPKQYQETFGSFKNSSGQPLTNTESQFPRKMPVVQARGILNFNFFV
ncbi:carbonic anhydrase 2-like [Planococcus citri]|uniref:carbonic anhydrase 2-like n=1 Tax=Planococcus citri TaxID=170843 RepID=UPI0031F9024A